jgi:hypothetical protein
MDYNFYCNKFKTDKGNELSNGNGYAEFYENWFFKIKESCSNILEIGLDNGGSLKANYEYFQNAQIIGLDILDKTVFENDRIKTFILDQGNLNELDVFFNYCINKKILFDVILDDGSHDVAHQQKTFGKLFKLLKSEGLYIIEDIGSSYFRLGVELYDNHQTQDKINNNTINFLNQRPFYSPWIFEKDLEYINKNVEYITIFDKLNDLSYSKNFNCVNDYPIRSITSIIKKKRKYF